MVSFTSAKLKSVTLAPSKNVRILARVDSLKLRITPKPPEPVDELPTGMVWIERGPQRAALFTPDEIEPGRRYPLLAVLHGAGRQEELLMKAYRDEAERRQALFLVPRSLRHDLGSDRHAAARNAPRQRGERARRRAGPTSTSSSTPTT